MVADAVSRVAWYLCLYFKEYHSYTVIYIVSNCTFNVTFLLLPFFFENKSQEMFFFYLYSKSIWGYYLIFIKLFNNLFYAMVQYLNKSLFSYYLSALMLFIIIKVFKQYYSYEIVNY